MISEGGKQRKKVKEEKERKKNINKLIDIKKIKIRNHKMIKIQKYKSQQRLKTKEK